MIFASILLCVTSFAFVTCVRVYTFWNYTEELMQSLITNNNGVYYCINRHNKLYLLTVLVASVYGFVIMSPYMHALIHIMFNCNHFGKLQVQAYSIDDLVSSCDAYYTFKKMMGQ